MQVISSKDNEIIKEVKKLKEKKYRDWYGEFLVEGIKMIQEAIEENVPIKRIIICDECVEDGTLSKELLYTIAKYDCIYTTKKVFQTISDVTNPQGILAVIKKKRGDTHIAFTADILLVLDGIQDPGNLGTILRTADSCNMKQIIVSKNTTDVFNPKVVRSTMGAIYRVEVIQVEDLVKTVEQIQKEKFEVIATSLETNTSLYDVKLHKKAIIIGNEARGVSKEVMELADQKITIPMLGKTESLNASVATAIILYEYVRQTLR